MQSIKIYISMNLKLGYDLWHSKSQNYSSSKMVQIIFILIKYDLETEKVKFLSKLVWLPLSQNIDHYEKYL